MADMKPWHICELLMMQVQRHRLEAQRSVGRRSPWFYARAVEGDDSFAVEEGERGEKAD